MVYSFLSFYQTDKNDFKYLSFVFFKAFPKYQSVRCNGLLQYLGHLKRTADSMEKTLMQGKTEGKRRRGRPRMRWLDSITDSMDMNLGKLREMVKDRKAWCATVHRAAELETTLVAEQQK